jgi:hypothetical protein
LLHGCTFLSLRVKGRYDADREGKTRETGRQRSAILKKEREYVTESYKDKQKIIGHHITLRYPEVVLLNIRHLCHPAIV